MNQTHHYTSTDRSAKIFLLKNQTLFAHLDAEALQTLSELCKDVVFPAKTPIVKKQEVIDCIYLIVSGKAEVLDAEENTLALLHAGEAIGLSETGFFSKNGLRTADVYAKTNLHTLRIDINQLQAFIETHNEIDLAHSAKMMLRVNFIKQIEPFAELDYSKVIGLMDKITEMFIPQGKVIFTQGDHAEECFFLISGKVEISFTDEHGKNHKLAECEPPSVFGEIGLLTKSKRNATATTREDSSFLVLRKKDFYELLRKGQVNEDKLIMLLIDRERFHQEKHITLHKRKSLEGKEIAILKNQQQGNYIYVSEESLFVWNLLDGDHNLQDIALAFYKKYNAIAVDEIADLLLQFIQSGFIHAPQEKIYLNNSQHTKVERVLNGLRKVMEAHITFKHVNTFLSALYKRGGYILYNKIMVLLLTLITIAGAIAFVFYTPFGSETLAHTSHAWLMLVLQSPFLLFVVPLHELAHALTTKHYGRQVRAFGVGWFWIGPMAFTDTSDMWLSERKPRLMVTFSGLFFNLILAGIFALLAFVIPSPVIATFIWLFALSNYLAVWANLDPLLELDGYFLLMDYFDKPNLRAHALTWLIERKGWHREYLPEIMYWLSCIGFILIGAIITFALQYFILDPVLPKQIGFFAVWHLQWLLPTLFIVLSSVSLYVLVRRKLKLLNKSA